MSDQKQLQGIFNGPESGSQAILQHREEFINLLADRADQRFLMFGAIIDTRLFGFPELSEVLLRSAREYWPEDDWKAHDELFQRVWNMAQEQNGDWHHEIYVMVQDYFDPAPAGFVSYLLPRGFVGLLFSIKGDFAGFVDANGGSHILVLHAIVDLALNGQDELCETLCDSLVAVWSWIPRDSVCDMIHLAKQAKASGEDDWLKKVATTLVFAFTPEFAFLV